MAEQTTKAAIIGAIGVVIVGIFGATQQPWWWCNMVGCAAAETPPERRDPVGNESTTGEKAKPDDSGSEKIPPPPPQPKSQMEPVVLGMAYSGNDINQGQNVKDAEACSNLCLAAHDCNAMTYIETPFAGHNAGECWMKGAVPQAETNPHTISARKVPASG